jgi:hypothetical protein
VSVRRPALILLLFAAARVPFLIFRAPFFDELFTRWISAKPFAGIVDALRLDSGPPLYYFLIHLLGDPSITAIRVVSLLCSAISIVLILLSGSASQHADAKQHADSVAPAASPAMRAALLLAIFPPAILFSVDARAYALCAMFVTIAVLAVDRGRTILATIALVLAAYCHYYGVLLFPILFLTPGSRDVRGRFKRVGALAIAAFLYLPGFWLAFHQPSASRAWMTAAWPDALFVRLPLALGIIAAFLLLVSARPNRYILMVLIPLAVAIGAGVYVPLRFESIIATPLALWIGTSLQSNRFRLPLLTSLAAIGAIWTCLGLLDVASRPPDPYRQAARWVATNVPEREMVVASGYSYLETVMNGHSRVAAFPPEQGEHPGWRAQPHAGLRTPPGPFFWTGERQAPELGLLLREHRVIEPLFINDRAMVALVR